MHQAHLGMAALNTSSQNHLLVLLFLLLYKVWGRDLNFPSSLHPECFGKQWELREKLLNEL